MGIQVTIVDPEAMPLLAATGLRRYEDYVSGEIGELVGESGTTQTRRISLEDNGSRSLVFLKTYRYAGRRWRHRFRRDKAWLEARNYRLLRESCGVRAPDVICHGSRRKGLRLLDAFILTRAVEGAVPLDTFVAKKWPNASAGRHDEARGLLLYETAELVARMHAVGFYHIDLQWRNVLVVVRQGCRPVLYVIDSSRGSLRKRSVYRAHGRLRDLSSLYKEARIRLTRTEQVRWLRRYLDVPGLSPEHHLMVRTILADRGSKDHDGVPRTP